jgi:copper ion binding protein
MKKIILLAFILFVSCSVKSDISNSTNFIEISLPTMQCNMCVDNIEKSLNKVDGIVKFHVKLNDLIVKVKYDTKKISQEEIELAISNAGYKANAINANIETYNKLAMCCKLPEDRK